MSQALRDGLGLCVEDEFRCPRSGYSIDMLVRDARPSEASTDTQGSSRSWAVEYDGSNTRTHARSRTHTPYCW